MNISRSRGQRSADAPGRTRVDASHRCAGRHRRRPKNRLSALSESYTLSARPAAVTSRKQEFDVFAQGEDGPLARLDDDAVRRASGGGVAELLVDRAAAGWLEPHLEVDEVARVVALLAHPGSATIHDQTTGIG
jgi:hypothetical protein